MSIIDSIRESIVDYPQRISLKEDPAFGSTVEENPEQRVTEQANLEYREDNWSNLSRGAKIEELFLQKYALCPKRIAQRKLFHDVLGNRWGWPPITAECPQLLWGLQRICITLFLRIPDS